MAKETDLELGYRVRDKISGFEGIVTDIGYHITGCTRFGAIADDHDDPTRRGATEWFYAAQLVVENEYTEFAEQGEDAHTDTEFELGDKVVDDISGFKGIATTITYSLYNCPRVAISPRADASGLLKKEAAVSSDDIAREWFDAPRVDTVGDGIRAKYEETIQETQTAKTGSVGADVVRKEDKG